MKTRCDRESIQYNKFVRSRIGNSILSHVQLNDTLSRNSLVADDIEDLAFYIRSIRNKGIGNFQCKVSEIKNIFYHTRRSWELINISLNDSYGKYTYKLYKFLSSIGK